MSAALKLHREVETDAVGEVVLADYALQINEAHQKAQQNFYDYLDAVCPPLRAARNLFGGKGRDSDWGKWLSQNTPLSKGSANRLLAIDEKRSDVNSRHLLPINEGQWQALESVPNDKLNDVLIEVKQAVGDKPVTAKAIKQVAEKYSPLAKAKEIAIELGRTKRGGKITIDDVVVELNKAGVSLGNNNGSAAFSGKQWEWTGTTKESTKQPGRLIRVWQYVGDDASNESGADRKLPGEVVDKFSKLTDRQKQNVIDKLQADPVIAKKRMKHSMRQEKTVVEHVRFTAYDLQVQLQGIITNHGPNADKRWLSTVATEDIEEIAKVLSEIESEAKRMRLFLQERIG